MDSFDSFGKPQKSYFLNGSAIKSGGGVKGLPLRKNYLFLGKFFFYLMKKFRLLEGGGQ